MAIDTIMLKTTYGDTQNICFSVPIHVETVVLLIDKKVDGHVDNDLDIEKLSGKDGTATYAEIKDQVEKNMGYRYQAFTLDRRKIR